MSEDQLQQQLGGSRKGSPLDDENCYPLTMDEYLTIKDNLLLNKFTSLESVLLSIFITTMISGIIFLNTNHFYTIDIINETEIGKKIVNIKNIIIFLIYSTASLSSLIGLVITRINRKKGKSAIQRLDKKIINHLE